jgi:hypothetical protein
VILIQEAVLVAAAEILEEAVPQGTGNEVSHKSRLIFH